MLQTILALYQSCSVLIHLAHFVHSYSILHWHTCILMSTVHCVKPTRQYREVHVDGMSMMEEGRRVYELELHTNSSLSLGMGMCM